MRPLRCLLLPALLTVCLSLGGIVGPSAAGMAQSIAIELSSSQSQPQGCIASFLIENLTGKTLDRFNVDLLVMDAQGNVSERLIVDLAPLADGQTRIAALGLSKSDCGAISGLVVYGIPECRAADSGIQIDCMKDLTLRSQTGITLKY